MGLASKEFLRHFDIAKIFRPRREKIKRMAKACRGVDGQKDK